MSLASSHHNIEKPKIEQQWNYTKFSVAKMICKPAIMDLMWSFLKLMHLLQMKLKQVHVFQRALKASFNGLSTKALFPIPYRNL